MKNIARAAAADLALTAYNAAKPTDPQDRLADLLSDLMHHARLHGRDFDHQLRRAKANYDAEIDEES